MIKWQTKKKSRSVQRKTRSFFRQRRSGTISVDSPKWPPSQNTNPQRRHSTIFVWMPTWTISCTAGYSQHAYMLSFWRCRSKHKICSTVIILWMLVWTIICTAAGYRQHADSLFLWRYLPLAGAATSTIFVVTKTSFDATKVCFPQQNLCRTHMHTHSHARWQSSSISLINLQHICVFAFPLLQSCISLYYVHLSM